MSAAAVFSHGRAGRPLVTIAQDAAALAGLLRGAQSPNKARSLANQAICLTVGALEKTGHLAPTSTDFIEVFGSDQL